MTNTPAYYNTATITAVKRFTGPRMKMTDRPNSQAYNDLELITAVKVFMIQAPGALRLTAEIFFD